jgi:two-component system sensor histidine kinase/response regulator
MTANAMAGDKEKVLEAGMNDHIAKPLNVADMFATIVKWVKPAGAGFAGTQPTAQVSETQVGLPALAGIDTRAGLAVCMNNPALYQRMLVKFSNSQGQFAQLFAAARQDSDPTASTRCAHTLKGTAGNIGAKALESVAAALEHACQTGEPDSRIDALLAQTLEALSPVMQGLAGLAPNGETPPNAGAGESPDSRAPLKPVIAHLQQLLAENLVDAVDIWEDKLPDFKRAYPDHWRKINEAMTQFDFVAALAAVKQLAAV